MRMIGEDALNGLPKTRPRLHAFSRDLGPALPKIHAAKYLILWFASPDS